MIPEPQTPVTPIVAVAAAKPGSSDHRSQPITLNLRLERHAVDAHALDCARRGALAAGDLRALERRAGRRRAGEQPLAIAEHDLGVGADIDEKGQFVLEVRALGEHDPGRIRADVAGDAGQRVDEGAGRDVEAEFARARFVSRVEGQARTALRRVRSGRGRERDDA